LIAVLFAAMLIPVAGLLGSRIGGRKTLLWSYGFYIALTIPEFYLMQQGQFALALVGLMIGILPYALCQAGTYATMPELYPTEVRHTGIAFGHSTGAVIGGGLSPYLVTWLTQVNDNPMIPAYYLIGSGIVGMLVVALWVKKNHDGATHLYR
jgi:MHS family proline/betaine transporter-like MFS transporter